MNLIFASDSALKQSDYGCIVTEESTMFKLWAPIANSVELAIYESADDLFRSIYPMTQNSDGIWTLIFDRSYENHYYTYLISYDGKRFEVVDPYAVASSANSKRALIVDLRKTDPLNFRHHPHPKAPLTNEIVLYELHIRDYTISPSSHTLNSGKYLGLTEDAIPLQHLVDLGVTHAHIMPVSDYKTVDECHPYDYNWGYDPVLFNVPEGSYATDPNDMSRITELKKMIMTLHEKGIRVILDVVYNHTYLTKESSFNRIAPQYFYRMRDGYFSNGSGCGNELATEKPFVRKFIIDSLKFWLNEYKVDGFRFDLMGLYDIPTMNVISHELRTIRPDILLYGEPWIGGDSSLAHDKQFLKGRQKKTHIAVFNDDFRDAIKGDNDGYESGVINGNIQKLNNLKNGILGEIHTFADSPSEVINYICAHDNLILRDKIEKVTHGADPTYQMKLNQFAFTIQFTSFGIPFLHEGTEFYRTKFHDHNSYKSPDHINGIRWELKEEYHDFYHYVKSLIAFRKNCTFFNYSKHDIEKKVKFYNSQAIHYSIHDNHCDYHFYHNYSDKSFSALVPKNSTLYIRNGKIDPEGTLSENSCRFVIEPKSSLVYKSMR